MRGIFRRRFSLNPESALVSIHLRKFNRKAAKAVDRKRRSLSACWKVQATERSSREFSRLVDRFIPERVGRAK